MKILYERALNDNCDVKSIIKHELNEFMTKDTINMTCEWLNECKYDHNSAAQIGYNMYHYPFEKLLNAITDNGIDGKTFIENVKNNFEFIQNVTGWKNEEAEQIILILFKHRTLTKKQFIDNVNNVFAYRPSSSTGIYGSYKYNNMKQISASSIPITMAHEIKRIIVDHELDVEQIHYNIKNNKNIALFNNIINRIDDLIENKDNNYGNDLRKHIYTSIAQCFISNNPFNAPTEWICANCGNCNFSQYIGGILNNKVINCTLCGITEIDSIILKLRNRETFIMVGKPHVVHEEKDDYKADEIDTLIQEVVDKNKIDLDCLNINADCPAMKRLCQYLIKYKRLLKNVNDTPMNDAICKIIDNNRFRDIFVHNAKSIVENKKMELLMKMLDGNTDITNINTFLATTKKEFSKKIKQLTGNDRNAILPSFSAKLYKQILISLKVYPFLMQLNLTILYDDYSHILRSHIENGSKSSIENVFRFFEIAVHYEEKPSEVDTCLNELSKRRNKRIHKVQSTHVDDEIKEETETNTESIRYHSLKQDYIQSELDTI
eukprot:79510_1